MSTAIVQIFSIHLVLDSGKKRANRLFLTPLADQETHEKVNVTELTSDDVW